MPIPAVFAARGPRFLLAMMVTCYLVRGAEHARGAEVSILPLGDSITDGNSYGGYRAKMASELTADGHVFHLLGSKTMQNNAQTAASLRPPYDGPRHEGHGGWRIDHLDGNLNAATNHDQDGNGGYFITGGNGTGRQAIHPDFVLVLAGINDINQHLGEKSNAGEQMNADELMPILKGRMASLIDNLSTLRPDSQILLSNVIPYANGLLDDRVMGATAAQRQIWAAEDGVSPEQELGVNHYVILFNKWLKDEFVPTQKEAGVKIELVDQYKNFILPNGSVRGWGPEAPDGYGDYGLHPNQFGHDLMGATWAEAIGEVLEAEAKFSATIDRNTVAIVLTNRTDEAQIVTSLQVSSPTGAIGTANLTPVTGNYDAAGDSSFDDGTWSIDVQSPELFRESTTGDGGTLGAGGSIQLSSGNGWIRTPLEDLRVQLRLGDGTTVSASVSYTGNNGSPWRVGDFNHNGQLDRQDYEIIAENGELDLTDKSVVQAYLQGDLNSDGVNDFLDFRLFKDAYIAEHGAVAFARLTAVPEPSTIAALGMLAIAMAARGYMVAKGN
jgi:lysophospholipase L1-like esterase